MGAYAGRHGPWLLSTLSRINWAFPAVESLAGWEGDGVILPVTRPDLLKQLRKNRACFVNISAWPDVPTVTHDNEQIGRFGAEHLVGQGYRRLAFIGIRGMIYSAERAAGFMGYCAERGLELRRHDGSFRTRGDWSRDSIQEDLIAWLGTIEPPVGVMCCHDERACHLLAACRARGLSVPGQVGVLGVNDDPEVCELCHPMLSSVRLNTERLGYEAAKYLDERMTGRADLGELRRTHIPPLGVCARQSTEDLHFNDEVVTAAVRFIRLHPGKALSVEQVAREACVSRPTLERRFRSAMGCTPFDEIRKARLEHVKGMLVDTEWDLGRIAHASAFRDARSLGEVFRKELGVTPLEYRRQHGAS